MHRYLNPKNWKAASGYSNGVVAEGRQIYVAGQVGWNAEQIFESDDFAAQAAQALENVMTVVALGGGQPAHVVRMTWFVTDKREYLDSLKDLGGAYRRIMGGFFPAMSLVQVAGLVEDGAKVEIEATAVVPYPQER